MNSEPTEHLSDHDKKQADKAKASLQNLKDQVAGQAKEHAEAARERLHGHAEERRNRLAENLRGVASGLDSAAGEIREKPETAAWQADGIARVSSVASQAADYLGNHDTKELLTDARDYAKRYPLATIGGALVLGLVGARLLKASEERDHGGGTSSRGAGNAGTGPSASHPDPVAAHGTMSPSAPGASTPTAVPPPPSRSFEASAPPPTGV